MSQTVEVLENAVRKVPELARAKFNETVEVSLHLGVDPRKMVVRGVCNMPHGLGKTVRVAVFASGEAAQQASEAGAIRVGLDDLADEILNDNCPYDVIIAHPQAMPLVGTLGKKLGPKGLMPNPKLGTVADNVAHAVTQSLAGQVTFKLDKAGIIHCAVGRAEFKPEHLEENIRALVSAVKKQKPAAAKGHYMQKLYISTTMSRGSVRVDTNNIDK